MKRVFLIFLLSLGGFLIANVALADTCTLQGYTIIYINGILATDTTAKIEADQLRDKFGYSFNNQKVTTDVGQNPSELWGADDLLKTLRQLQFWDDGQFHEDADVDSILNQIHSELTTQKVLLVGHSQGAFYANDIYYYLTTHGMSKDSVGVYDVATPANQVAGNGTYETSFSDSVIEAVRKGVVNQPYLYGTNSPLPANMLTTISPADPTGHLFVPSYLDVEPATIVGDIQQSLSKLKPTYSTDVQGDCFTPPPSSATDKTAVFIGDHSLSAAEAGYIAVVGAAVGVGNFIADAAGAIGKVASDIQTTIGGVIGLSNAAKPGVANTNFNVVETLYGSKEDAKELEELMGPDQGGAVVLSAQDQPSPQQPGQVLGTETEASDAQPQPPPAPQPLIPPPPPVVAPIPGGGAVGGPAISVATDEAPAGNSDADTASTTDDDTATTTTDEATTTPDDNASSTPFVLSAPQNVVFSGWRSNDDDQFCSVMTRFADVSWDPVPGATSYQVWEESFFRGIPSGDLLKVETASTSASGLVFEFGLNWDTPVTLEVVAADGNGAYATTSINVQDVVPRELEPLTVSFNPAPGDTDVPLDTPISITYDEPLDPDTIVQSFGLFHTLDPAPVSGPSFEGVAVTPTLEADGKTVDLIPPGPLAPGKYDITGSCYLKDLYGNHAGFQASYELSFFTTVPADDSGDATSTP